MLLLYLKDVRAGSVWPLDWDEVNYMFSASMKRASKKSDSRRDTPACGMNGVIWGNSSGV